jgi:ribokinase
MMGIVVLGSINMDLVVKTQEMPRPGETVRGRDFITIPGGKGANQAASAARMGARVEMVGRVGADSFGPTLLENMRQQGVGTGHIIVDQDAASGIAMIIVDANGENSIVVAPGANGRVSMDDVRAARDLLAGADYLLLQLEVPFDVVRGAIEAARSCNLPVILNAAPAYPLDPGFVDGVYCLVVNESETRALTGIQVDDVEDACRAAHQMAAWGVQVVIVTLGAQGAYVVSSGLEAHVPARKVKVIDTTAAGDAFIGGLAVALGNRYDLLEAVRYATCAGTLATTVLGAQTSLPSAAQVRAFYDQVWAHRPL